MLRVENQSLRTHYDILSVNEDASYDQIRENYKIAVLRSHPDKLCASPVPIHPTKNRQEIFLNVQKAWEVLSDPKSRQDYDDLLQASRNEAEVVDNEIKLGEMVVQVDGDGKELSYQCRCGDHFFISSVELQELGFSVKTSGASVILPCDSCSLKISVVIDVKDDLSMYF
ncbi:DPH4 homolog [Phalaenopsis equestris]|uniref:DPH4 homolog n=1 Tax=Phalaenopsis equestris TaxID=78828 RepID=UPI0009E4AAD1|nr:DPH4 homolog [Phalaenopsis equestris]XP_020580897.1 DPH4 homolog [Phalaenopsis equestris]